MAAQRRGSVKVLVQPPKLSLEAMATRAFSSRSGRTWKSSPLANQGESGYEVDFYDRREVDDDDLLEEADELAMLADRLKALGEMLRDHVQGGAVSASGALV